jgi:hypothetical protein
MENIIVIQPSEMSHDDIAQLQGKYLFTYAAFLRAGYAWFHGAHHLTKGMSFSGDHAILYDKIYNALLEMIDAAIERGVGLSGHHVACPQQMMVCSTQIVCAYPTPAALSSTGIAAAGHSMICDMIKFLEETNRCLEDADALTLGLSDLFAADANTLESFIYLLKQRMLTEMG